jgi:F0F1-type ATP synthase assembly protein I
VATPVERRAQKAVLTFATGWSKAFEIAGVTAVFTLIGFWLDSVFDTRPILTIVFFLLAVAGLAARSYYAYQADMALHEEEKPWTRRLK